MWYCNELGNGSPPPAETHSLSPMLAPSCSNRINGPAACAVATAAVKAELSESKAHLEATKRYQVVAVQDADKLQNEVDKLRVELQRQHRCKPPTLHTTVNPKLYTAKLWMSGVGFAVR